MAKFQTLDDLDVRGRRVLLRADLNVPLKDGVVTDATRIERLAPTIEGLIEGGAQVVVMSHFGRPEGRADPAFFFTAADRATGKGNRRPQGGFRERLHR
jgi:phosphoglycerate kinase